MVVLTPLCFFLQPVIRLYAVPLTAFTAEEEDEEAGLDLEDIVEEA